MGPDSQSKDPRPAGVLDRGTLVVITVFLTQIISRRQKNADAKVALSISRQQKWKSRRKFSKNCIFPNIQLKGVANKILLFKNLFDRTNRF